MPYTVTELLPGFGARVEGIDLMEESSFGAINDLWHKYQVLVFPGQELSEQQQIDFATRFGPLEQLHKLAPDAKTEYVLYVSNRPEDNQRQSSTPDGELKFHMDQSYRADPSKATLLYGLQVPVKGGATRFASMTRAYRALPAELRQRVSALDASHSDFAIDHVHPLVVRHPDTGENILYYARSVTPKILGLDEQEEAELTKQLEEYLLDEEFVYDHHWTVGDLVMWDNRSVLHARTDFNPTQARVLRRVTVKGGPLEAGGRAA
ncbi:MAG TPA: TauD/TfdA family dioxygenase [Acidimicrobiales bacterium]|nr:TauD/TfdA family dioxygenase [Acidimicrobiales bacterium]